MSEGPSKKKILGGAAAVILLVVLVFGIVQTDWDDYTTTDTPLPGGGTLPSDDSTDDIWTEDGELREDSLAYTIFEKYGLVLIPLALLMFGAMVGGVVISREEVDSDDSS